MNIKLSGKGLKGRFPLGLVDCTSLVVLDLSGNQLSGAIPLNISRIVPFVTSIDLSSNNFSGEIPRDIVNCSQLQVLKLDNNRLVGSIPWQIGFMSDLRIFSVANNQLSGPVPAFAYPSVTTVTAEGFVNNTGLCGWPLEPCGQLTTIIRIPDHSFKIGFVFGFVTGVVPATVAIISYCTPCVQGRRTDEMITVAALIVLILKRKFKSKEASQAADLANTMVTLEESNDHLEENRELNELRSAKSMKSKSSRQSSRWGNFATRLCYERICDATNGFSQENLIGSGKTGLMYKGRLPCGGLIAVKRLNNSGPLEEQLTSELKTLGNGNSRHPILVPLLGFCMKSKELLLVYKFMPNGNLYDWLHPSESQSQTRVLEWPIRVKIVVGLAKGLARLHQDKDFQIIHLNLCSKCVLLDQNFEPKLSNFVEALLISPKDKLPDGVSFVGRDFWTMAYVKEDVYNFGALLLELMTGEYPNKMIDLENRSDGRFLNEWVSHLLSSSTSSYEVIDKNLIGRGFDNEIFQLLKVAFDCVQVDPNRRPTMFQVYQLVEYLGVRHGFIGSPEIPMQQSEISPADSSSDENLEIERGN